MLRAALPLVLFALGCQSFFAPDEDPTVRVEGCNEAVAHLRSCCPAWDLYLSCTYRTNNMAVPDLTTSQSQCIVKKSCNDLAKSIMSGGTFCGGYTAPTRHCR
jgi:hypothetical protein